MRGSTNGNVHWDLLLFITEDLVFLILFLLNGTTTSKHLKTMNGNRNHN